MSRMTESEKKHVPKSERGVPGKSGTGSYPMPDESHAKAAVGLAAMHHGSNSPFTKKIKAKAHKLGYEKGSSVMGEMKHDGKSEHGSKKKFSV